ncbi:predicted protein [Naegleria gruberi]|uniref:Predicted protein n=1 Tax=Naegleria gruberi TaxID=5762 RepID=D2VI91_NAEGR|nr:uncharacterized protein NAEGRDRAFT_68603 [Naegleria gruberi]EFC43470.1 predicted protein [Naegleria gruberi]|eukprot:XP_002676214.1 predicted protein [Naegleria gruberi strain NEG-M]
MDTGFQSVNITDELELLVILLDINPYTWGKRKLDNEQQQSSSAKSLISFSQFINQLLVFINTFLTIQRNKKIAVIASSENNKSHFLFPNRFRSKKDGKHNHNQIQVKSTDSTSMLNMMGVKSGDDIEDFFLNDIGFESVQNAVLSGLNSEEVTPSEDTEYMEDDGNHTTSTAQGFSLSGALSMALCFINRLEKEKPLGMSLNSRILTFQVSPDISSQYISVMNAIFSAEKMSIMLDACVLSNDDSTFLQQACFLTGGNYLKPQRQEGLIQYLLTIFMLEKSLRSYIQLPVQNTVDFRASCFETRKPIDDGYVCPVCLSIFSSHKPVCSTCASKLQRPTNRSVLSYK